MPVAEAATDTTAAVAVAEITAVEALEHMVLPPIPGPGDPEGGTDDPAPTVWAAPRKGLRGRALLQRTVTHEPIGELHTALVPDWDEDVDQIPVINAEASSWDPLWEAAAVNTVTYRGRKVHEWDPKGLELLVGVGSEPMAVGVFRQPLDVGGDRVSIAARGPEVLWAERTLGRVEQYDHYQGWGNFEQYPIGSTPPGITFRPVDGGSMTAVVVADASVRGGKALEVTGAGWIQCPKVRLPGHSGVGSSAEGSTFGKFPAGMADGTPVVQTWTQRVDSLIQARIDQTFTKAGKRPSNGTAWSDEVITSGAVMDAVDVEHWTWVQLVGHDTGPCRYDVTRLQQGVQSGSLIERPFTWYADRFLGDVQNEALGGASWGMARRILAHSTGTAQIQVSHNQNPRFDDVMAQVTAVDGGCAVWVDASFTANIAPRRGQVRNDVAFNPDTVLACRWAQDPSSEIDDWVGDSGRGTATSMLTSTVSTPRVAGRHRITRIERVPSTWHLNRVDAYARRQAAIAAQRNVTCELDVPWAYGRRVACGDTLPVILVDGRLGMFSAGLRVVNKRYRPLEGIITFTMGGDGR